MSDDVRNPDPEGAAGAGVPGAGDRELAALRAEVESLRQVARHSPQRTRELEARLAHVQTSLSTLSSQNERLVHTLKDAREQIVTLKKEVDRLAQPPSTYGLVVDPPEDGSIDIITGGRKMRVAISPSVDQLELGLGREVMLNEALNVVSVHGYERVGEVVTVKERLDDDRVVVVTHGDEERVCRIATPLLGEHFRVGDSLTLDPRSNFVHEVVPKLEVEELVLEEVPDVEYEDIGGLAGQIEAIRDAVELPFLHPELYKEHALKPPKGVLLYGPPGCGKTLIAKAVAASLARQVAARTGKQTEKSYFLNIKGPELLNKYVGETERHIRLIFQRAREKASDGTPVVVFFDEMDSLFRTRGSGVSSDVETTIVPQLLAEIDGVERLDNVIVIGASNREDMIDPAILRPGRLDAKIKIERPDAESARDIFSKYLTESLPLHEHDLAVNGGDRDATVEAMITAAVERMYSEMEENRFLEVTYQGGDKEILYFKDFNSGAMIQNIVDRAKKLAIKDFLTTGQKGIRVEHLLNSCVDEFKENEDLPNTTNPDDWARISGKKGERIVYIRTLLKGKDGTEPGRSIATANTGQYL
ncbi:proteasome ATPase [Terrabacter sp. Root85]|uniref:proteasome ATPase n=1 Tax=Terrabacter sp. Root85 TaxID=1736603 RepID=UPI0007002368|nr:proteasome ATPase [Terrabacter sp. Root85]KRC90159.1 proteasome ATPase [Terrabacter sp. Root85]